MRRKAFWATTVLLFVGSAAFGGDTVLYPVVKNGSVKAGAHRESGVHPCSGSVGQGVLRSGSQPAGLGWAEDVWQYFDPEHSWLGNYYYWGTSAALEFVNDVYKTVTVKEIEYNLIYSHTSIEPLGGHIWEEEAGTGQPPGYQYPVIPKWESPSPGPGPNRPPGVAHRDFDIYDNPTVTDFWFDCPDSRAFTPGERFWVGWEARGNWSRGDYQGWNWDPSWDGYSWWWDGTLWFKIIDQPGAPYSGCWTMGVSVEYERYDYDAQARSISDPGRLVRQGTSVTPKATVRNNGQQTVDFDVTCVVTPGGYLNTVHTPSLATGEDYHCVFADWAVPGTPGVEYTMEVYTALPGDEYADNDTFSMLIKAYRFWEDFENDDGEFTSDPAGCWQWGTPLVPEGAHSGEKAWATGLTTNYDDNACWKLQTRSYQVGSGPQVGFGYWHQYEIESGWDGYNVQLSTDMGESWLLVEPDSTWGDHYNQTADTANACIPEQTSFGGQRDWSFVFFDITSWVDPCDEIYVRFDFGSDPSITAPGVVIDDFYGICMKPFVRPDLDIHDDYCNLDANRMRLTGIPGAVVVGYYLLVNPDTAGRMPNVDLWDGPGDCDFDSLTYQSKDLKSRTRPDSLIAPDSVNPNLEPVNALGNGEAAYNVLQVHIPLGIQEDIYVGQVTATGWCADTSAADWFELEVEVVPAGSTFTSSGLWGEAESGQNAVHWSRFGVDELGYNLYRTDPYSGSFGKLNGKLIDGTSYFDEDILSGAVYRYQLGVLRGDGRELLIGPISLTARGGALTRFGLLQNYPNPFGAGGTTIQFRVQSAECKVQSAKCRVSLRVYDLSGRLVRVLVDAEREAGRHVAVWDGRDESGRAVSAGVYFYRLACGDFSATRKMLALR